MNEDKEIKISIIQQEILDKQKHLDNLLQNKSRLEMYEAIKPLSDYTPTEKISEFDRLYKYALNIFNNIDDDDNKQYVFETVMELLARNKSAFWDYYHKKNN